MTTRPRSDELRDVHRGGVARGEPRSVVTLPLVALIRLYQQTVSRILGPVCRYYPSCSAYGVTALERHGLLRGGWLTTARVLRCHPWAAGGVDHVPPRRAAAATRPGERAPHTPPTPVSDAHHRP